MISAEIVCDSVSPQEKRLTTFKLRYPKFIHGEFMTHRVISRNASSSRAIPVKKLIQEVRDDALRAAPIWWGKEQKGMQALEELTDQYYADGGEDVSLHARYIEWNSIHDQLCFAPPRQAAQMLWKAAALRAADCAEQMERIGAHKQIVNRLLEPFSHINVVATATEWDNFFGLRLHKDAMPEMRALAIAMWEARKASTPKLLKPGKWHLPFVSDAEFDQRERIFYAFVRDLVKNPEPETLTYLEVWLKVSVARCARVSYESFETGKRSTVEEDLKLYEKLLGTAAVEHAAPAGPIHASPAEHQATPDELGKRYDNYGKPLWEHPHEHGNFVGFRQFRKMLVGEAIAPLPEEFQ